MTRPCPLLGSVVFETVHTCARGPRSSTELRPGGGPMAHGAPAGCAGGLLAIGLLVILGWVFLPVRLDDGTRADRASGLADCPNPDRSPGARAG